MFLLLASFGSGGDFVHQRNFRTLPNSPSKYSIRCARGSASLKITFVYLHSDFALSFGIERWYTILHNMNPRVYCSAVALTLAAFLVACTEAKPVSFPMRTALPFGSVQMTVESTEATSDMNRKGILVHARMEGLEGESQARVAAQSWDQLFRLADRDGKKYRCRRILPTDIYYHSFNAGTRGGEAPYDRHYSEEDAYTPVPTDWILRFDVPLDAEGFTLLIDNMRFHKGDQPVAIGVPLDR